MESSELKAALEKNLKGLGCGKTLGHGYSCGPGSYICSECKTLQAQSGPLLELFAENDRLTEEYDKAWRHDLNDKNNVQVLTAEVVRLNAEIERLRTAEGDAMTCKAGVENVAQQRDQLKAEVERLKHENRLLTEHNEFLASSDSRLAPELRAVKDALGLDFTASVAGEVVPLIERLRKLPTCWTEVLEQSEANDQLLDQVLELSRDADRLTWLEESAEVDSVGPMRCCGKHQPSLREAIDAAMALEKSLTQ